MTYRLAPNLEAFKGRAGSGDLDIRIEPFR